MTLLLGLTYYLIRKTVASRKEGVNIVRTSIMYHPDKNFSIKLAAIGIALASAVNISLQSAISAQETDSHRLTTSSQALSGNLNYVQSDFPPPPKGRILKKKPETISLYEWDKTPLGSREPFLFVHGLRGEYYPIFVGKKLSRVL